MFSSVAESVTWDFDFFTQAPLPTCTGWVEGAFTNETGHHRLVIRAIVGQDSEEQPEDYRALYFVQ